MKRVAYIIVISLVISIYNMACVAREFDLTIRQPYVIAWLVVQGLTSHRTHYIVIPETGFL